MSGAVGEVSGRAGDVVVRGGFLGCCDMARLYVCVCGYVRFFWMVCVTRIYLALVS